MQELSISGPGQPLVEPLAAAPRPLAGVAAAAAELNSELTVVLSGVSALLEEMAEGRFERIALLEIQRAAERCAQTALVLQQICKSEGWSD